MDERDDWYAWMESLGATGESFDGWTPDGTYQGPERSWWDAREVDRAD